MDFIADKLDGIARQTGLLKRRSRGFSAEGLLLTLLKSVGDGRASFRQMTVKLAMIHTTSITKQALHQRLKKPAVDFLAEVLKVAEIRADGVDAVEPGGPFRRILLQDATQIRMHQRNSSHYRAMGNNSGRTSAAKVDLIHDLLAGEPVKLREVEGRVQDRTLGPGVFDILQPGDLLLRDMGYFDVEAFERVERCGAHWISRLHGQAGVKLPNGSTLEQLLEATDANTLDMEVLVTDRGHRVRLVAFRCSEEVASRNRQARKEKRRRNGTNANKTSLIREGWTIYLTNLSGNDHTACKIQRLYRQRWAIEIRFRALKGSTSMKKALNRITNKYHLQALIIAAMILSHMTSKIAAQIAHKVKRKVRQLSIEKTCCWLSQQISNLCDFRMSLVFDPRQLLPEKRKRPRLSDRLELLIA